MPSYRRRLFGPIVLLLLSVWLSGCTNPLTLFSQPTEEAAADSPPADEPITGTLTIYTTMGEEQTNAYLRLFRGAYPGVEVTVVTMDISPLLQQLLAEKEDPQADVIWGLSATAMALLEWQDVLIPYAPEGLDRVYLQFRDTRTPPYWVGFGAWMSAFCVNNERLEALNLPKPDSWKSLRDPIYAGQIAVPRPDLSATGYMIVAAQLEFYGEVQGWEDLDALDKNVKVYTESSYQPCEMAAKGDVAIGVSFDVAPVNLASAGEPVEAVFATEGAGWDIEANGLLRKDDIKDVARLFLDWAISDPVMQVYGESRVVLSMPAEDHSPPPGFPEQPLTLLYDKDFPWASANRERILAEWLARYAAKLEEQSPVAAP